MPTLTYSSEQSLTKFRVHSSGNWIDYSYTIDFNLSDLWTLGVEQGDTLAVNAGSFFLLSSKRHVRPR